MNTTISMAVNSRSCVKKMCRYLSCQLLLCHDCRVQLLLKLLSVSSTSALSSPAAHSMVTVSVSFAQLSGVLDSTSCRVRVEPPTTNHTKHVLMFRPESDTHCADASSSPVVDMRRWISCSVTCRLTCSFLNSCSSNLTATSS